MATGQNYKRLGRGRPEQFSTRISGIALTEEQGRAIERWTACGTSISEEVRRCIQMRIERECRCPLEPCDED